jgi:predicted PurR-regulated permease PerM
MSLNRYFGIGLTLAIVAAIFYYFSDVLSWVLIAWVISLLGAPLLHLLGKIRIGSWQMGRASRAVIVLALFYGLAIAFLSFFIPVLVKQARNLAGVDYNKIMVSLDEPLSRAGDWLVEHSLMKGELSKYYYRDNPQNNPNKPINPQPKPVVVNPQTVVQPDSSQAQPLGDSTATAPDSSQTAGADTAQAQTGSDTVNVVYNLPKDSLTGGGMKNIPVKLNKDSLRQVAKKQGGQGEQMVVNVVVQMPQETKAADAYVMHTDSRTAFEALKAQVVSYFDLSGLVTSVAAYLLSILTHLLVLLTSVTFIAFFFLKDDGLFGRGVKRVIPNRHVNKVDTALSEIKTMLSRYFGGILLQVTCITIYTSAALGFFGIPNAILIGFFAALINVIPYVGPILGAVFGLILTLGANVEADFYALTLPMLWKVVGVFLSMQLLDNFILQPVIFSSSVKAHPLEIFFVVIIGAKIGGITGMVVAIPIYTIVRVIAAVFLHEFEVIQKLAGALPLPDEEEAQEQEPA